MNIKSWSDLLPGDLIVYESSTSRRVLLLEVNDSNMMFMYILKDGKVNFHNWEIKTLNLKDYFIEDDLKIIRINE